MKKLLYLLPVAMLVLAGCDSEEPDADDGPGEQELITQVRLSVGGQTFTWTDADGPGGGEPVFDTIRLAPNTAFPATVEFFNTIDDEDVTEEIREEDEEHQVFFTIGGDIAGSTKITVTDADENGLPIGLSFEMETGRATNGTLTVTLSHYDDAPKDGVTRSDETDIEVTYPVEVGVF
ncbi:MAG: type 1 periplasmic binding fold superfamily protein [Bacteroidota bacterium]